MDNAKTLAVIGFFAIFSWWGYYELVAKPEKHDKQTQQRRGEEAKRFNDWAYVAKEKEISPGERIKLVIVPHPWGDFFDTKCLIYTNEEFRQSSMICPDADKEYIADK